MTNPFDGPGQLAAIAALIAVIAYLRNVPMKEIRDFVKQPVKSGATKNQTVNFHTSCWWGYVKYSIHSVCQVLLMLTVCLLAFRLRSAVMASHQGVLEAQQGFVFHLDEWLATIGVVIAIGFVIMHIILDGLEIIDSVKKLCAIGKAITRVKAEPNAAADGGA